MDEDDLINAIGLLMTQLRVARRALEDIERSTARYNNFAFAAALSAGAKFGEPPMFGGALKVWVVNINDLAPGAGGGFIEQLLGGIGRLFGGFGGGLLGGTVGGVALPIMIGQVQKIADSVERILMRLGIDLSADKKKGEEDQKGPGLISTLTGLKDIFTTFTSLFLAASGKPGEAEKNSTSLTPGAERWLAIVKSTSDLMTGIDRVIQGLTFLIPIVVGALAEFIVQLDRIKLAVVQLLQFLLRELFLLRGVVLVTFYDTLSAVAKLASSIMGILSVAVNSIVSSMFNIFGEVFKAAIAAIKFISDGLQTTIDRIARWLVDVIGDVLFTIGDSLVFREVVHVVQMLPGILPPLVLAIRGEKAFSSIDTEALKKAAAVTTAAAARPGTGLGSSTLPSPPLISETLQSKKQFDDLTATVGDSLGKVNSQLNNTFGTATGAFKAIQNQLDDAVKDKTFTDTLQPHIAEVRKNSETLADALKRSEEAAAQAASKHPATGLEVIATAYEEWLKSNGLKQLLDNVTDYFKRPEAGDVFRDKAVGPTTIDRPRATVDIQDVIIQLKPPDTDSVEGKGSKQPGAMASDELLELFFEAVRDFSQRGKTIELDALFV